jgi:hypothetical protein
MAYLLPDIRPELDFVRHVTPALAPISKWTKSSSDYSEQTGNFCDVIGRASFICQC